MLKVKGKKENLKYQDKLITVQADINVEKEIEANKTLDNAIKITVKSDPKDVHFIQFATRQVPDMWSFNHDEEDKGKIDKLSWNKARYFYMQNYLSPQWKLDIFFHGDQIDEFAIKKQQLHKTIYYEEKGACIKQERNISLYDQPGPNPAWERFIGCTFIVIKNKVTHLIRWSIQHNKKGEEFYCVDVKRQNYLSHWAVKLIHKTYNNLAINSKGYKELLKSQPTILKDFDFNKESRNDFLICPNNWETFQNIPILFGTMGLKRSTYVAQLSDNFCDTKIICKI